MCPTVFQSFTVRSVMSIYLAKCFVHSMRFFWTSDYNTQNQGRLKRANMISAIVAASPLLRFAANAMPTLCVGGATTSTVAIVLRDDQHCVAIVFLEA